MAKTLPATSVGIAPAAPRSSRSRLASKAEKYRVFLSHSSRDTWIAEAIAKGIRQQGGDVWLDANELSGGDPISREILAAVDDCDEAIVLLSPYSIKSNWVLFEMGAVYGQHKRITPILIHVEPQEVPVLGNIRSIDINLLDQAFLPELAGRIAEKVTARWTTKRRDNSGL